MTKEELINIFDHYDSDMVADHVLKSIEQKKLRDYFAAKAMQGILSNPGLIDCLGDSGILFVKSNAYQIADAMMEAREVSP